MKTVIIGSGIAGLAMARLLQQKGHEVVVCEKQGGIPVKGNAFLINEEGMLILQSLDPNREVPGILTNTFHRFKPNGRLVNSQVMDDWYCCRRSDLIQHLVALVATDTIVYGRSFSHFIYRDGIACAAVFQNGEIEYGDVFVGADGSRSAVRQKLFGDTAFSPVEVREILGIAKHPALALSRKGVFSKFQSEEKGLSFGFIPVSEDELIWFSQVDVSIAGLPPAGAEELRGYTKTLLAEFQEPVQELIDATNFSSTYVWNTTDFETLSAFHKANIVLVGDAAHMAVPFTSAGVTNALQDVKVLVSNMEDRKWDLEEAFRNYYHIRMPVVHEHLLAGRNMKKVFLNPREDQRIFHLPLVPKQPVCAEAGAVDSNLEVLYFTDPICSTCWTIQPQLRKLKMEYAGKMEFHYHMSGLLPGWEGFNRGGIQTPEDVARHWEEVAAETGMPIDGDLWRENPLHSSYPPSLAFKAAQMQGTEIALEFLRKMNEAVFMKKKNISSENFLIELSGDIGMDQNKFLRDLKERGNLLFQEDLNIARKLEICTLPTLVFQLNGKIVGRLSGVLDYDSLQGVIRNLKPEAKKNTIDTSGLQIFNAYSSLTTKEFAFILGLDELQAELELMELEKKGEIQRSQEGKSPIWVNKRRSFAA